VAAETVDCSCGVPGCPELGWPHEWDPIAADDECLAVEPFDLRAFLLGDPDPVDVVLTREQAEIIGGPLLGIRHRVRAPYVRHGSGYACQTCVEASDVG